MTVLLECFIVMLYLAYAQYTHAVPGLDNNLLNQAHAAFGQHTPDFFCP